MKNQKIWIKLFLDFVMLVVFLLLMWKNNFGLVFHEIAGISIFGMFLVHIILNWGWVVNVSKKFFSLHLSTRLRISWLLNMALLICFALIGLSGIFISKVVFNISVAGNWKVVHYFCSSIAIILLGVHLGLHATMIGNAFKRMLRLSSGVGKVVFVSFLVVMIGLSCYSINSTSFKRWLSMPFSAPPAGLSERNPNFASPNGGENFQNHNFNREQMGEGNKGEFHGGRQPVKSNFGSIFWKAIQYFSIVYLFAFITGIIEWIIKRRKIKIVSKMNC